MFRVKFNDSSANEFLNSVRSHCEIHFKMFAASHKILKQRNKEYKSKIGHISKFKSNEGSHPVRRRITLRVKRPSSYKTIVTPVSPRKSNPIVFSSRHACKRIHTRGTKET